MKRLQLRSFWLSSLLILLIISLNACKEDDPEPDILPDDNPYAEINNWIYDVLDEVYYWTDELPASPNLDQTPEELFEDLKYEDDRFSVLVENYDDLINSLEGVSQEAGYEFALFKDLQDNVSMEVLYVKEGSPAQDAGLLRGDIITAVNGTAMTFNNYQEVLPGISMNHSVTFLRFNATEEAFEEQPEVELETTVLQEDPNLLSTILPLDNGKKVGYFVYTFFSPGPGETSDFDNEMDDIFADFKAAGITDLVVDLRYNSGGAVSSAVNLASLIAPDVTTENVFYENRWNDLYTAYWNEQPNGDDILYGKFTPESSNVGSQLTNQTVYILTGQHTASASELIINGLSPYMNVVTIGEETVGKNVGSVPIQDTENPANDYGLLPIVFRVYNSAGQSDYSNGFTPVGENVVKEFDESQLPLEPLGDLSEPVLARALELITGESSGTIGGRQAKGSALKVQAPFKTSLDDKAWANRLILDPSVLK